MRDLRCPFDQGVLHLGVAMVRDKTFRNSGSKVASGVLISRANMVNRVNVVNRTTIAVQ